MKISVIGTGYVGLVTGACFASIGHNVTCLDIDEERIDSLKNGKIPFHEPKLQPMVLSSLKMKKITFTTSYEDCCRNNILFICVGTPSNQDGSPNLDSLKNVMERLKDSLRKPTHIFIKSTVPLGTNAIFQDFFDEFLSFSVTISSNPEFLKEGDAVNDSLNPDRVIIGTDNSIVKSLIKKVYAPFNWESNKLQFMSKESAELTKYAANAFLATKISFINEMSKLCEATGASISEVKKGMGADIRIGNHFLNAGLGYGGSCFPKDVSALIDTFRKLKLGPTILEHTKRINEEQLDNFIKKIESNLSFSKLAIWGLSFKPNSDDIRESVAIKLIKKLSPKADQLNLYDPIAMEPAAKELKALPNISFLNNRSSTLLEVDALIICTEWEEFKILSKEEIKMLRNKIIFDGRNILNRNFIESNQVVYYGIGE